MRMTIKSMSIHVQHIDANISQCKIFLSQVCPPILLSDIIDKIRVLNSKLYSFLKNVNASKLAKLFGPRSDSSDSTGSANESNLVFTIPPDLPLSDPERSVLAKGLKFVPNSGPIDLFSVKEDTEAFFRHLHLKAYFHNQSSTYNKHIFEQVNPKKSSWPRSLPEGQFSSLDLFVRQCRHVDRLNHSRRKRPSNLSTDELLAFKSLRSRIDVVIKPADKGGAVVVWRADLYRQEALRQLNDASYYTKLNSDPTLSHQKTVKTTINHFIQAGDLPASASNLFTTTPRTPVIYFLPEIHKPDNPGKPIVSASSCPTEFISSFLDSVMFPLVKT